MIPTYRANTTHKKILDANVSACPGLDSYMDQDKVEEKPDMTEIVTE